MKRFAIILGSESYNNYNDTDYCYGDAELLRETLEGYCNYQKEDIYLDTLFMGLDTSTPNAIRSKIIEVLNKVENGDTILFYYAGHGIVSNKKAYLVLPDTDPSNIENTALDIEELKSMFSKPSIAVFWIFDACHSGEGKRDGDFNEFYTYLLKNTTIATLAACSSDECSYTYKEKEQGAFTYYLCKGIRKSSINKDIFLEELKMFVCEKMEQWCDRHKCIQHPTLNVMTIGNVPFANRNEREDSMSTEIIISESKSKGNHLIEFNELMKSLNPNISVSTPQGLVLPSEVNVPVLVSSYAVRINPRERGKIANYYDEKDFMTAAEKVWNRTMAVLRDKVLSLGEDFVADMLGIDDTRFVRDLQPYMLITLANQLGFINDEGEMNLRHANDYMNHYLNEQTEDELPRDEANIIIKNCVKYIVGFDEENFGFEFNDFRYKLKSNSISDVISDKNLLITCPYFFKKTTVRTLISLLKSTEAIEFEQVVENMAVIIPIMWDGLLNDEKFYLGSTYAQFDNDKDDKRLKALKSVLVKVKGFDFVPENIRSTTFVTVATKLIAVHYGMNNFYNEPLAISNLEKLGNKFPKPALRICVTAVLLVKLGNTYNFSWDAQTQADAMLKRLTEDDWRTYLEHYLPLEKDLVNDLLNSPVYKMVDRWKTVVRDYGLTKYNITNKITKRIIGMK